ncbi:putative ATP-dependent 6-phosphofructokinase isozyme 2 [Siccirubricoccus deserti]|uniref:1-phosphofructokinase family hexose kinase n=1 Tax=Siccirubricoccus deserti TaxID=2013562 RepID=UPI0019833FF0|nr:1-phosphofructokinase family hexose kinase [Siccirubricoccus deserti]GGC58664.1 putative ATP-dependent 6-phosphofructokinase isozyme 2 [Siccirubricoccus deserti]
MGRAVGSRRSRFHPPAASANLGRCGAAGRPQRRSRPLSSQPASSRIVTLTLNPSLDIASDADAIVALRKVRTRNERFDPGGGGINVSRVVQTLGGETLAIIAAGGLPGALLEQMLEAQAVPHRTVGIAGWTRMAHTVNDLSTRREFRFVPEGPELTEAEWRAVLAAMEAEPGDWVVGSGSLPLGVPAEFYVHAAELARRQGRHFVLDTSGAPLKAALGHGLALIKPSRGEFEALVGRPLGTPRALNEAALAMVRSGAAGMVVVSLGQQGALLATPEAVTRLPALDVPVVGAVGAGDSLVAGMVLALARGESPKEAFAWGMATGAAAVMQPGTARPRPEDVAMLRARIGAV